MEGKSGSDRGLDRSADADATPDGLKRPRGRSPKSRANAGSKASAPPGSSRDDGTASGASVSGADEELPFGDPPDRANDAPRGRATKSRGMSDAADRSAPQDLRAAAARLKKLGIHDFQLSAGDTDQTFVFVCRHVSPQNPRVVRRFEAEAADPQAAVEDVLRQVESWQAER